MSTNSAHKYLEEEIFTKIDEIDTRCRVMTRTTGTGRSMLSPCDNRTHDVSGGYAGNSCYWTVGQRKNKEPCIFHEWRVSVAISRPKTVIRGWHGHGHDVQASIVQLWRPTGGALLGAWVAARCIVLVVGVDCPAPPLSSSRCMPVLVFLHSCGSARGPQVCPTTDRTS